MVTTGAARWTGGTGRGAVATGGLEMIRDCVIGGLSDFGGGLSDFGGAFGGALGGGGGGVFGCGGGGLVTGG